MCNIPQPSQACQLCQRTGRKCTFLEQPLKKSSGRGPPSQNAAGGVDGSPQENGDNTTLPVATTAEDFTEMEMDTATWPYVNGNEDIAAVNFPCTDSFSEDRTISPSDPSGVPAQGLTVDFQNSPLGSFVSGSRWEIGDSFGWVSELDQEPLSTMDFAFDPVANLAQHPAQDLPQTNDHYNHAMTGQIIESPTTVLGPGESINLEELSLDKKSSYTDQWFGFTNESDPFLLDKFPSDARGELKFYRLTYRNMRDGANQGYHEDSLPPNLPPTLPTHFLRSHRQTAMHTQEMVTSFLKNTPNNEETEEEELRKLVDPELGATLITL